MSNSILKGLGITAGLVGPYALAFGAAVYANRNEPQTGEFKTLQDSSIKTTVYSGVSGYRQETYNFATDSAVIRTAFGAPRRGFFTGTRTVAFEDLEDTTGLHIAHQMKENGFTSAQKVTEYLPTPHSYVLMRDNRDTVGVRTDTTFRDTSYVKFAR